jgi:hypothetical protein
LIYTFPAIKFIHDNTLAEQDDHIRSEFVEWMRASGEGEKDEELLDLYHSIETRLRMREMQGIDIDAGITNTVAKNDLRHYYTAGALADWAFERR